MAPFDPMPARAREAAPLHGPDVAPGAGSPMRQRLRSVPFAEGARLVSPAGEASDDAASQGAGATLVGLKRGDGLDLGTEDRRPRVRDLQARLNACMLANLAVDGLFGPKTGRALREFQESLRLQQQELVDPIVAAALDGTPPPGTGGAGGPQPDAAAFSSASSMASLVSPDALAAGQSLIAGASLLVDEPLAGPSLIQAGVGFLQEQVPVDQMAAHLAAAAAAPASAGGIGNPLVGVQRGDGLVFGTFDRRDRVRLLQTKLNERVGAGLVVDGLFGPLTTAALQGFQQSVALPPTERVDVDTADLLMDKGVGPEPGGAEAVKQAGASLSAAAPSLQQAGEAFVRLAPLIGTSESFPTPLATVDFTQAGAALIAMGAHWSLAGASLATATAGPAGPTARQHVRAAGRALAAAAALHAEIAQHVGQAGAGLLGDGLGGAAVRADLLAAAVALHIAGADLALAAGHLELP